MWHLLSNMSLHDWTLLIGGVLLGGALTLFSGHPGKGKVKPYDYLPPPSIAAPACPSGWQNTSVLTSSVRAYTCQLGDWAVVLNEQGVCERGRRMNPPEVKWVACLEVPGWPGN